MKRIAIFGSTGSIGQSALAVIRKFPKDFRVVALSTHSRADVLARQIKEFHPLAVCVKDINAAGGLAQKLKRQADLFLGDEGLEKILQEHRIDIVLLAISGSAALAPLLKAIEHGCDIALANKEALVMAGTLIMRRAEAKKVKIIPIDSEQSAIWQCLEGRDKEKVKNIYLTASGGPLLEMSKKEMQRVSLKKVLRHPRWKMGKKITVDSASLMNKGLEVLEAMYLFGVSPEKIKILIHPEAVIHSMVEFIDGIVMAQLSATDMRIPIQYALTYPERRRNQLRGLDFYKMKKLNFKKADFQKFPCLKLALRAAKAGGTLPCVMNAADEICVEAFLKNRLDFISFPRVIAKVMDAHRNNRNPDLEQILASDRWAKREAHRLIQKRG